MNGIVALLRLGAVLTMLGACTPLELPDPIIEHVVQPFAYRGEETGIRIHGQHFLPEIEISARSGEAGANPEFTGWLTPESLGASLPITVQAINDEILEAVIPPLPIEARPGTYALTVRGPTGREATFEGFEITGTRVAELDLTFKAEAFRLDQETSFLLELLDESAETVAAPAMVLVWGNDLGGVLTFPDLPIWDQACTGPADPSTTPRRYLLAMEGGSEEVVFQSNVPGLSYLSAAMCEPSEVQNPDRGTAEIAPGDSRRVSLSLAGFERGETLQVGEDINLRPQLEDELGRPVFEELTVQFELACYASGENVREVLWRQENVPLGRNPQPPLGPFQLTKPCLSADGTGAARFEVVIPEIAVDYPDFDVRAGPRVRLDLALQETTLRAGEPFEAEVIARDAFDNPAIAKLPRLDVRASTVAPDGTDGLIEDSRAASDEGFVFFLRATVAGTNVTFTAAEPGNAVPPGEVSGVTVLPSEAIESVDVLVPAEAAAGTPVEVFVQPRDPYGNAINASNPARPVELQGPAPVDNCIPGGFPSGAARFVCTFLDAEASLVLRATIDGVQGTSAPFDVVNGPLAVVEIVAEGPVRAGEDLQVAVAGFDALGNPYATQTDPDLMLTASRGSWSVPVVTLDGSGAATVQGFLTKAGEAVLTAEQQGVELGRSTPIAVTPGPTASFRARLLAPWAYVDQPEDVRVEATDAFGNRTTWWGTVGLTSRNTASPDATATLVNGVGATPFTWAEVPLLHDVLDVTGAPWSGSTGDIVVSQLCADGPTVAVEFAGHEQAIACSDTSGTATITADMSGSAAGAKPLAGYAVSVAGSSASSATAPTIDVELPHGRHDLEVLVVDEAGCASTRLTEAWVGPDDGTPVGPIALTSDLSTLEESGSSATIEVADVVNCLRGAADGEEIRLRTTAGELSGLTATGEGLALTLGPDGAGSATLETFGRLAPGSVEIVAWVPSGTAGGQLTLPLVGDSVPPTVIRQLPSGDLQALVSEITLEFSEPLLVSAIDTGSFSISGPHPATIGSITASDDDRQIHVGLAAPVDGALGVWTLTAHQSDIEDLDGNALAGDWGSAGVDYVGALGGVGGVVDGVTCTDIAPGAFRPDGDDGAGSDDDEVTLSVRSNSAPAWWVLEVRDPEGALVLQDWRVPDGAIDTVRWDGRGFDGIIVANGAYDLTVRPEDGLGNAGGACTDTVTVANRTAP